MATPRDKQTRRTASSAIAAAIIGAVVGIVTVAGVAHITDTSTLTKTPTVVDPVVGAPEYGSRHIDG